MAQGGDSSQGVGCCCFFSRLGKMFPLSLYLSPSLSLILSLCLPLSLSLWEDVLSLPPFVFLHLGLVLSLFVYLSLTPSVSPLYPCFMACIPAHIPSVTLILSSPLYHSLSHPPSLSSLHLSLVLSPPL